MYGDQAMLIFFKVFQASRKMLDKIEVLDTFS